MNEITWKHDVAYHTFFPMLILAFAFVFSSPLIWIIATIQGIDFIEYFNIAIAMPWIGLFVASIWISILGEYVMSRDTYKKYKSGEWSVNKYE